MAMTAPPSKAAKQAKQTDAKQAVAKKQDDAKLAAKNGKDVEKRSAAIQKDMCPLQADIMRGIFLTRQEGEGKEREYKVVLKGQKGRNSIVSFMEKSDAGAWVQKLQLVVKEIGALEAMLVMRQVAAEFAKGSLPVEELRKRRDEMAREAADGNLLVFLECR